MKLMKRVGVVAASALMFMMVGVAHATVPGPYVGGQIGWGSMHQADFDSTLSAPGIRTSTSGNSGFAGRAFAGYEFLPNWSVETGWTKFHNLTTKASAGDATAHGSITADAVDLVAKGTLPLQNCFSVFGKLGAAYLMETAKVSFSSPEESFSGHKSEGRVYPTISLGAGYDVSRNLVTDLTWTRIQKIGSSDLASTDLVAVGLSYHFG